MRLELLGAAVALALTASPADAAIVFKSFDFNTGAFGALAQNHTGSFSFEYDDATDAATLLSLNYTLNGTTFTTANAAIKRASFDPTKWFLYGTPNGEFITAGTNDFWASFNSDGSQTQFNYANVGYQFASGLCCFNMTETTPVAAAVPEPATWAMMLLGFGAIGASMRRRRRVTALTQMA